MKFKNGHWVVKQEFEPLYACETVRAEKMGQALKLLIATKHISGRGDTQTPVLGAKVFSPAEGVIGVTLWHHRGTLQKGPRFELTPDGSAPEIRVEEDAAYVKNGGLTARISLKENDWRIDFLGENGRYTGDGFRMMGHMRRRDTGEGYMVQQLELDVGECVYGLGERFTAFVKNGQQVDMWNGDGGSCSELAYKNVPFYMTNRGYGVLVDDAGDVSFEVASEQVERVQFSVQAEQLTYYVFAGPTSKEVLRRYTALTGRPALLPAWSFGLWLSTSFTTDYDEKTTSSFIEGMAQRNIPLNVFHYDCFWMKGFHWCDFEWDQAMFPDPEGMLRRYHGRGLKISAWINPYVAQASPLFDEGLEKGYFLKKENGDVWQSDLWQGGLAVVDFTNPAARDWYCGHLRRILEMGVDAFKTDFGERIPVRGIRYFDGSDPVRMHNYYTYLYNQAVREVICQVKGEDQAVLFARSATAGSQKMPLHWGGDNFATYVSMAETLRAGLSLASCGFGFWSHDISGFESTAPAHVYKRWCQFGLLSSHSRLHGSQSYRVPWLFDEEACVVLSKFTRLKCRLMPYLYQKAVEATETGTPVMRPMYMEFPEDPACDTLDRQYMMGESLLVAPVFHADSHVDYYLPDGLWTSLLDGRKVQGGRWQKETHDFLSLPLMVRPGTVLPMGQCDKRPDYDYTDGLELHVYQLAEGQTVVVKIPDLKGQIAATYTVTMKNGQAEVVTDSEKPYTVIVHE